MKNKVSEKTGEKVWMIIDGTVTHVFIGSSSTKSSGETPEYAERERYSIILNETGGIEKEVMVKDSDICYDDFEEAVAECNKITNTPQTTVNTSATDKMILNYIIKALQDQHTYEDRISKFVESISDSWCVLKSSPSTDALHDIGEMLLTGKANPDVSGEDGWFVWFVRDNEFGKEKLSVFDKNNKEYVITNISQLYDFLHETN